MISSQNQKPDNSLSIKENSSYLHSDLRESKMTDSWSDTEHSPSHQEVTSETNGSSDLISLQTDNVEEGDIIGSGQDAKTSQEKNAKIVSPNGSDVKPEQSIYLEEKNFRKHVAKSKRDRVENIVTSIKDKPSKICTGNEKKRLAGDLLGNNIEKESNDDNKGDNCNNNAHKKQNQLKEKIRNLRKEILDLQNDYVSGINAISSKEENLTDYFQNDKWVSYSKNDDDCSDRLTENFSTALKSPTADKLSFHCRDGLNVNKTFEKQTNIKYVTMAAYDLLVDSLKRELSSALEEVVDNSAKRVLEEMQSHMFQEAPYQSMEIEHQEDNNVSHGHDKAAMNSTLLSINENYNASAKRYCLTSTGPDQHKHFRTANKLQMCFGEVQVSKGNASQSSDTRSSGDLSSYSDMNAKEQHGEWSRFQQLSSDKSGFRSTTPEHFKSSKHRDLVQTQPLNLVKKSIVSPVHSTTIDPVSSANDCTFVSLSRRLIDSPCHFPQSKIPANAVEHAEEPKKSLSPNEASSAFISSDQLFRHSVTPEPNFYRPNDYQFIRQSNHSSISLPCLDSHCPSTESGFVTIPQFSFSPNSYSSPDSGNLNYTRYLPINSIPFPTIIPSGPKQPLSQRISQYDRVKRKYGRCGSVQGPRKTRMLRNHDHGSKQRYCRYGNTEGDVSSYSSYFIQEGLTPQHLKKAKLMFFYTRYPSAITIKTFFSDVKFTRATTSQLVKWFSNFREFYYIQMEKFARQALSDGVSDASQLSVTRDSEIFRALNHHYNKSNDFKVPPEFLTAVLKSLQEFFTAIQNEKDNDPAWKKVIYKVVCKYDQEIPEIFKSRNVLENLHKIQ